MPSSTGQGSHRSGAGARLQYPPDKGTQVARGCGCTREKRGSRTSPIPTPVRGEEEGKSGYPSPHPRALSPKRDLNLIYTRVQLTRSHYQISQPTDTARHKAACGAMRPEAGWWPSWRRPGPTRGELSPRSAHHVEVGEHIPLRVLLVSLVDVGAHGHQQLQVQDAPLRSVSPEARGRAAWQGRAGRAETEGSRKQVNCDFSPDGQASLSPCAPGLGDTVAESCLCHSPLRELVGPIPRCLVGSVGGT